MNNLIIIGSDYDEQYIDLLTKSRQKIKILTNINFSSDKLQADTINNCQDVITFIIDNNYSNIIFIGKNNVEIDGVCSENISEYLYLNYNIHLFTLDGLIKYVDKINLLEFENIINCKQFIFLSVIGDDNYSVSNGIRYFIKMHNKRDVSNIFLKNGFKIITYRNFKKKMDLEKCANLYDEFLIKYVIKQQNSIIISFHPVYWDTVINNLHKSNTIIFWIDDTHYFAHFSKERKNANISVQNYAEKYDPDYLKNIDLLITPSPIYFKNLNITEYDDKIRFLFYMLDYSLYDQLKYDNFLTRKNQIILSGAVYLGYKGRYDFLNLQKKKIFEKIIYHLEHPGYDENKNKFMTEINYYNKLSEFKGAFVSHYVYPINFLLAKHIEVLMCGCLGFFQKNPLLEKELGLIEFEHYIPCSDEEGNIIEDPNFYVDWLRNGEQIAKKGAEYVRSKFGKNYLNEYINIIKNTNK